MLFILTEAGQTAVPYDPSKSIVLQSACEARWGSTELPNDFADFARVPLRWCRLWRLPAITRGQILGHPYLPKARLRQCSASERHEKSSYAARQFPGRRKRKTTNGIFGYGPRLLAKEEDPCTHILGD